MNPIQLFDPASSTYTYLLFDADSREALIIAAEDLACLRKGPCLHPGSAAVIIERITNDGKKRQRVFVEGEKKRYTSHWDLDHLPLEEIEKLHSRPAQAGPQAAEKTPARPAASRLTALSLIGGGILLLLLAIALNRFLSA